MTASELRSASTRIRHDLDFGQAYGDPAFLSAVADWLDACALVTEVAPDRHKGLALAVARAYLGTVAS